VGSYKDFSEAHGNSPHSVDGAARTGSIECSPGRSKSA
jgi:hypothetical protein